MKLKAFVSPRRYDCGHWSTDKYYYKDRETGKTLCKKCYIKKADKEFRKTTLPALQIAIDEVLKEEKL